MTTNSVVLLVLFAAMGTAATESGGHARYVGGTIGTLKSGQGGTVLTTDRDAFVFSTRGSVLRIPYERIESIEYGQEVSRRVVLAFVISPVFLLTKARAHYVTLGFTDEAGKHQAIVLRVDKHLIRPALATLEARSGRMVQYTDDEARKSRRG